MTNEHVLESLPPLSPGLFPGDTRISGVESTDMLRKEGWRKEHSVSFLCGFYELGKTHVGKKH